MRRICTLFACLVVFSGIADAKKISGTVSCGGEKLAGVVVSDGTSFAVTARNGRYTLDAADSAAFVFVVSPSGYTVDYSSGTPVFYKRLGLAKKYDFELLKTRDGDDYTLLCISDPQCRNKKQFQQFCSEPLQDICAQVEKYSADGLVAGLMLGDIGWDSFKRQPRLRPCPERPRRAQAI